MIFGLVVIAVVIAAALLSASSGPQFFMTVHVYSAAVEYTSFEQLPSSALVSGATLTITGPRTFGPETTPTGVLGISSQIPSGNYTITAVKAGYNTGTIVYLVGSSCNGRQVLPDGNVVCHALVRITNSTSTQ